MRNFWNNWIEFPDSAIGWYPYALTEALAYLRQNPVDVIFSTALPMTSHLVANSLSKRTGIPWVADFRDLWSQADYRDVNKLRKMIDSWLEVRTVKSASALITVSEPHMEDLLHLHKTFTTKNFVIYNGYDAEDYPESEMPVNRPFTITYTGRMYDIDFSSKGRTPLILFQSIAALFRGKHIPSDRLQCLIYGEHPHELIEMIAAHGLTKTVKCLGAVPFREAVKAQQQADVLLHLNWNDADQKGILSGKIFEYLGAKKNILSIPFDNKGVGDILRSTQSGVILNNVEACKEQIWRWFQDFEAHGAIPYHGIPAILDHYSRKKATEQLAAILNQVSQAKG
ncbi:MAG: glycosyltransferase [Deltaproteobacteria bacterium]|nr:glycosyltransferase [Deltaproteobacteria bacterium]